MNIHAKINDFLLGRTNSKTKNLRDNSPASPLYQDSNIGKSCFSKHVKRSKKRVIFKLCPSNLPPINDNKTHKNINSFSTQNQIPNFAATYSKLNKQEENKYSQNTINHTDVVLKQKPPVKRKSGESVKTSDSNFTDSKGFLKVPPLRKRRGSTSSLCTLTTDTNSKKISDTSVITLGSKGSKCNSLPINSNTTKIHHKKKIIRLKRKEDHLKCNADVGTSNIPPQEGKANKVCDNYQNSVNSRNVDIPDPHRIPSYEEMRKNRRMKIRVNFMKSMSNLRPPNPL